MESTGIKKAKELLKTISQDEEEIRKAELREKFIRDQHAIMLAGIEQGIKQGIEQGIEQGIIQGISQNQEENARRMLKKGYPLEDIAEITGLSLESIHSLVEGKYSDS